MHLLPQCHHHSYQGMQGSFFGQRLLQHLICLQRFCKHGSLGILLVENRFHTHAQAPRLGYEEQNHIDPHCVKMDSAAMIHFGLDPGKFSHFQVGKYTGRY